MCVCMHVRACLEVLTSGDAYLGAEYFLERWLVSLLLSPGSGIPIRSPL